MLFALYCEDKPDSEELRKANRDAHLAYAGEHLDWPCAVLRCRDAHLAYAGEHQIEFAGPLLSDDGERMVGSLIILDAADLAAAQAFAEHDPYAKAQLFAEVKIRPIRKAIGR